MRRLKNRYFAQRHGRSEANEGGVVANSIESAIKSFGLIEQGRHQIRTALCEHHIFGNIASNGNRPPVIVSSDFLRTLDAAHIASSILRQHVIRITPLLRERHCGDLEGGTELEYIEEIIPLDEQDPTHKTYNVESLREVQNRALQAISVCESLFDGEIILMETHREVIHMLLCYFKRIDLREHNQFLNIQNGEIVSF